MASVLGLDEPLVDELCRRVEPFGRLWKANLLGPGNTVVSGDAVALEHVERVATELGAMKVIKLAVAGAFHSPLMKPADRQLAEFLAGTSIGRTDNSRLLERGRGTACRPGRDPGHTCLAGARGGALGGVNGTMIADGFDTFYEIGPGRVLTGLLKRIDRKIPCTSIPAR